MGERGAGRKNGEDGVVGERLADEVLSDTRASTLCIENLDPARAEELEKAFREFCDLAERYLDARIVSYGIATKGHPVIPSG
mgnify:CR=1 FL=1